MSKTPKSGAGCGFAVGFDVGFDLGTSPHGLSAELLQPVQETPEAVSSSLPAKLGLGLLGDALPLPGEGLSALERSGTQSRGSAKRSAQRKCLGVYTSPAVRRICRSIRAGVAKLAPKDVHYLRLTEAEFLHAYAAVEQDRSRTYKAIRKGIADPQDLKASDSLWQALQDVQARRLKKAWRL